MVKVKLGEVCTIVSGSTPRTSVEDYWDGDIIWITPAELDDETYIVEDSVRKITQLGVNKTGLKPFPKGTVILSSRAPIGKVAIAGKEMYCNQGFKNLICSESISNEYLYWFLKGKNEYLNSLGRGATFKEISKSIVENIEIEIPSIQKQRQIFAILKKCWSLMNLRKKQVQLFDNLIKSRFVELFSGVNNYRSIEELCLIITDGTHQPPKFQTEGIPFIFVSNIANNTVTYETEKFISEEAYNELIKRTPVEIGDILLSTVGSYGHSAVVTDNRKFLFQRHIAYLKPRHEIMDSFYLHEALLSPAVQRQIEEKVKGIAQKTLNLSEIRKILIPIPKLEDQKEFKSFVNQVDKLRFDVQQSLDKTQILFDSLMQEYFG